MMKVRNRISNLRFSGSSRGNLGGWSSAMDYLDSKPMTRNLVDWIIRNFQVDFCAAELSTSICPGWEMFLINPVTIDRGGGKRRHRPEIECPAQQIGDPEK